MLLLAFNSACRFRLLVSVPLHGRSTFLFKHEAYTARTGEVECNFCTVWFALSMPKRINVNNDVKSIDVNTNKSILHKKYVPLCVH